MTPDRALRLMQVSPEAYLAVWKAETDAKCAEACGMTVEEWEAHVAQCKHDGRMDALPQVDALMAAGWKFEIPSPSGTEPWQWYWRRPPRRKGSKGQLFLSTNQAFNAMTRERPINPQTKETSDE